MSRRDLTPGPSGLLDAAPAGAEGEADPRVDAVFWEVAGRLTPEEIANGARGDTVRASTVCELLGLLGFLATEEQVGALMLRCGMHPQLELLGLEAFRSVVNAWRSTHDRDDLIACAFEALAEDGGAGEAVISAQSMGRAFERAQVQVSAEECDRLVELLGGRAITRQQLAQHLRSA